MKTSMAVHRSKRWDPPMLDGFSILIGVALGSILALVAVLGMNTSTNARVKLGEPRIEYVAPTKREFQSNTTDCLTSDGAGRIEWKPCAHLIEDSPPSAQTIIIRDNGIPIFTIPDGPMIWVAHD